MALKLDNNMSNSVIASFKHMIYLNHRAIESIECTEQLSTVGLNKLRAAKLCNLQMSRMCNIVEYLLNSDSRTAEKHLENFEIENLIEEITKSFCATVSSYTSVNAEFHTNLKGNASILIDKATFELVILNILYCCLKNRADGRPAPVKLSISATENKDNVVFHIRDNNPNLEPDIVESIFTASTPAFESLHDWTFGTLISLSLRVAYKSAEQLNGSVVYTPLKSGNRFDISLPKYNHIDNIHTIQSLVPYIPTRSYYDELFADVKLEFVLKEIIDCFGNPEDFKL